MRATHTQSGNSTTIALSIFGAGVLIAGALFFGLQQAPSARGAHAPAEGNTPEKQAIPSGFRAVDETDHVLGNTSAPITIVEYSDFECPFCARLHPTLENIVAERDDVNWVYRHFPLSSIHARAFNAAHASECVAELAGNDAFWSFSKELFNNQRSLGPELYERLALEQGATSANFRSCTESQRHEHGIDADFKEVQQIGGRGTPYVVVINSNNEALPFSGALPRATIEQIIETMRP